MSVLQRQDTRTGVLHDRNSDSKREKVAKVYTAPVASGQGDSKGGHEHLQPVPGGLQHVYEILDNAEAAKNNGEEERGG